MSTKSKPLAKRPAFLLVDAKFLKAAARVAKIFEEEDKVLRESGYAQHYRRVSPN